jgi:beta-galactosidase
VIVRAAPGRGRLTLRATAPGLKPATLTVDRIAATPRAQVANTRPEMLLSFWARAPFSSTRPDPLAKIGTDDRYATARGRSGRLEGPSDAGRWNGYQMNFTPPARVRQQGGVLTFTELAGTAEIWIDGKKLAEKRDPAPARLDVTLPAGQGERNLVVLVEAESGKASGFGKMVVVRETVDR